MAGLRVIICGGRDYDDRRTLFTTLDRIDLERGPFDVLIHGNARGADSIADAWAKSHKVPVLAVLPDWQRHGKAAGPVRNRRMITDCAPNLVIAFPGGRGTANMINQARAAKIEVIEIG
jgi:hypothetical protein